MHVTVSLARRIERAEIEFCAAAGSAQGVRVRALDVGGGRALHAEPGSPLNKVLGLGVGAPVTEADLDAIEAFFGAVSCPAQIELCPLAAADLPSRLSARGYALRGFENELGAPMSALRSAALVELTAGVTTRLAGAEEEESWLDVVAEGFAAGERQAVDAAVDADAMMALRNVMRPFGRPPARRYLARVDGAPAGGGASFVWEGTLGIFGTATVPRFRRRGVQRAIVAQALADSAADADVAVATTEPGSTSQRTFERLGFRVLYTRAILVKDC